MKEAQSRTLELWNDSWSACGYSGCDIIGVFEKNVSFVFRSLASTTLQPRWKARWSWQWQGLEIGGVAESKPSVFVAGMRLSCTVKLLLGCCWLRASVASLFFVVSFLVFLWFSYFTAPPLIRLMQLEPAVPGWSGGLPAVGSIFCQCTVTVVRLRKRRQQVCWPDLIYQLLRFIIFRFHSR